ncbi:helix-turn-helix domain-containing protein [Serratia fonticola]
MKTAKIFKHEPPIASILKINAIVNENSRKVRLPRNTTLTPSRNQNIYFINGAIDIIQKTPNHTIATSYERLPIGLVEQYYPLDNIYYKLREESDVYVISHDVWNNSVNIHNLFDDVCRIFGYMIYGLMMKVNDVFTERSVQMINNLIYRYYALSEVVEIKESLALYILNRTTLSKSLVMKVLASYRADQSITMVKGRLKAINKPLKVTAND